MLYKVQTAKISEILDTNLIHYLLKEITRYHQYEKSYQLNKKNIKL